MFISTNTSIYLADTRTERKFVYLPEAAESQGRVITFKDYYGNASISTFRISTISSNTIDTASNYVDLNQDFQSLELTAIGATNWSLTGYYDGGLVRPFRANTLFGISSLSLWLDPTDLSTMTLSPANSNDILQWRDKSSNAYVFTPVNQSARSQRSTNCITIAPSTAHFLSQQSIPGSDEMDLYTVILDTSQQGPMTGILQNADCTFWETDGRYHTQIFADGLETWTTITSAPRRATFCVFNSNLYAISSETGSNNFFKYTAGSFSLVSTFTNNLRAACVFQGRMYITTNGAIYAMNPDETFVNLDAPASNYWSAVVHDNAPYFYSITSNYPLYKYNLDSNSFSLIGLTGQTDVRGMVSYNGSLYLMNRGSGSAMTLLNASCNIIPPGNQFFTSYVAGITYSNEIITNQNATGRILAFNPISGMRFFTSNISPSINIWTTPVTYRDWIILAPFRDSFNLNITYFPGIGKLAPSGSTETFNLTSFTMSNAYGVITYNGQCFVGANTTANQIYRYGNGTMLDVNVSSIGVGTPRVVNVRKSTSNVSLFVNGTEVASQAISFTYSNNRAQQMYLGGVLGTTNCQMSDPGRDHMVGALYETLQFRRILSDSERQQIEGYLAWKYGAQANLPLGHPYLNSPP
jgi:hypothetical protein